MMRHVGPACSDITLVLGAAHVRLKADDYLNQSDLDTLIRELQQARIEVFGRIEHIPQPATAGV